MGRPQLSSSNDQAIYSSTQHPRKRTDRHQHLVNMEFSATAILTAVFIAALGFSGITCASSLYNTTCHNFDIHDLDGEAGRAVRLYAECKNFNGNYVQTNLDLNTCFGWATVNSLPMTSMTSETLAPLPLRRTQYACITDRSKNIT